MREIGEVHRHAHRVVEAQARGGGDRREVAEHAMRLRVDALGHLHGGRVEADLAGQVHRVARAHRLRIGADRRGRAGRLDRGFHRGYLSPMIPQLEKLLGTPRDGALLRYSLGLEYAKAGDRERAVAVPARRGGARSALFGGVEDAWGRALPSRGRTEEALDGLRAGHRGRKKKGDRQAEKEMTVFARNG